MLAETGKLGNHTVPLDFLPQQNGGGCPMQCGTSEKADAAPQNEARIVFGHISRRAKYGPPKAAQFRGLAAIGIVVLVTTISKW